jgi:transaldolase/glucose-6-phosphate isomerase
MVSQPNGSILARHTLSVGKYEAEFRAALERLEGNQSVARLWKKDPTLWKSEPDQQAIIANSLGWLSVAETMQSHVADLEAFAQNVKNAGFEFCVVLGMGGSSLCPEVLAHTFGSQEGFPQFYVLDSTVPTAIRHLEQKINLGNTLFIVASKSSLTTEPQLFHRYFRDRVKRIKGDTCGENFVAITDPGSQLAREAAHGHFRRIFLDMPDIGGRYSALSYFGLVPFALMGGDIKALLDHAVSAAGNCRDSVPLNENSGAQFGAALASLAGAGRNKLTLVLPPPLSSLGLWIEHLLAESTGKEGKGIIPIAGEPLGSPDVYGGDRVFVYIHLESASNADMESKLSSLEAVGHPVLRHTLRDPLDLGEDFFLWEFATAMAASLLGVNPFDQPDVQETKANTVRLLAEYAQNDALTQQKLVVADTTLRIFADAENCEVLRRGGSSLQAMLMTHLARLNPGDYFAIAQFGEDLRNYESLLQEIRLTVRDEKKVATTTGYGPRFLHSTGQLHKGGPDTCLFLQLTCEDINDIEIPGEKFSFSVLKQAQALGDFEAWANHHRRAIRVDLGRDVEKGLRRLLALVKESVAQPATAAAAVK